MNNHFDNFHVDVTCETREAFKAALSLFPYNQAVAFKLAKSPTNAETERLILYWDTSQEAMKGASKLPFTMSREAYTDFAWSWLQQTKYGLQPEHDGSSGKGFRIYNDGWAQVKDEGWGAFVCIEPVWAMYGK